MHEGVDRSTIKNLDVLKKIRREDASLFKFFDEKYNVDTSHPILLAPDGSGEYMPGGIDNHDKFPGSMGLQNSPLKILDMVNNFMKDVEGIKEYIFLDIGIVIISCICSIYSFFVSIKPSIYIKYKLLFFI